MGDKYEMRRRKDCEVTLRIFATTRTRRREEKKCGMIRKKYGMIRNTK